MTTQLSSLLSHSLSLPSLSPSLPSTVIMQHAQDIGARIVFQHDSLSFFTTLLLYLDPMSPLLLHPLLVLSLYLVLLG